MVDEAILINLSIALALRVQRTTGIYTADVQAAEATVLRPVIISSSRPAVGNAEILNKTTADVSTTPPTTPVVEIAANLNTAIGSSTQRSPPPQLATTGNLNHTQPSLTPSPLAPNLNHTQPSLTPSPLAPNLNHTQPSLTPSPLAPNLNHTQPSLTPSSLAPNLNLTQPSLTAPPLAANLNLTQPSLTPPPPSPSRENKNADKPPPVHPTRPPVKSPLIHNSTRISSPILPPLTVSGSPADPVSHAPPTPVNSTGSPLSPPVDTISHAPPTPVNSTGSPLSPPVIVSLLTATSSPTISHTPATLVNSAGSPLSPDVITRDVEDEAERKYRRVGQSDMMDIDEEHKEKWKDTDTYMGDFTSSDNKRKRL